MCIYHSTYIQVTFICGIVLIIINSVVRSVKELTKRFRYPRPMLNVDHVHII